MKPVYVFVLLPRFLMDSMLVKPQLKQLIDITKRLRVLPLLDQVALLDFDGRHVTLGGFDDDTQPNDTNATKMLPTALTLSAIS
jgi:hypothetical protein